MRATEATAALLPTSDSHCCTSRGLTASQGVSAHLGATCRRHVERYCRMVCCESSPAPRRARSCGRCHCSHAKPTVGHGASSECASISSERTRSASRRVPRTVRLMRR